MSLFARALFPSSRLALFAPFALALACSSPANAPPKGGDVPTDPGPCDGADLTSDGENCGACGHSCGGGACSDSVCQPAQLASGQDHPSGLAVANGTVVWTNAGHAPAKNANGALMSCPLPENGGCPDGARTIYSSLGLPSSPTVVDGTVYLIDGMLLDGRGDVSGFVPIKGTLDGGPRKNLLWWGSLGVSAQVVSGPRVYFGTLPSASGNSDAYLGYCPLDGCPSNGTSVYKIAENQGAVTALAVDTDNAYFTSANTGDIRMVPKKGGTSSTLFTGEITVFTLAQDDASLYWGTAFPASSDPKIKVHNYLARGPKSGGTKTKLADAGNASVTSIALDDTYVWFTESTGVVARVKKDGGDVEPLATTGAGATAVTLDGDYVYWVTADEGAVYRLRK